MDPHHVSEKGLHFSVLSKDNLTGSTIAPCKVPHRRINTGLLLVVVNPAWTAKPKMPHRIFAKPTGFVLSKKELTKQKYCAIKKKLPSRLDEAPVLAIVIWGRRREPSIQPSIHPSSVTTYSVFTKDCYRLSQLTLVGSCRKKLEYLEGTYKQWKKNLTFNLNFSTNSSFLLGGSFNK